MKDEKLLRLLKKDPDAGMDILIRQYSGLIFSVVRGRLSDLCDSSEIEDCVTDVFIKFYSGIKTFVIETSIKNYLAVIARNTACNYLRNKDKFVSTDDSDFLVEIPDRTDVAKEVAEKELLKSIYAEIERMGYPDSEIMLRKYYFGHSSKTIAADLDMTVSNVDTRAHRAMEKLKTMFGGKS